MGGKLATWVFMQCVEGGMGSDSGRCLGLESINQSINPQKTILGNPQASERCLKHPGEISSYMWVGVLSLHMLNKWLRTAACLCDDGLRRLNASQVCVSRSRMWSYAVNEAPCPRRVHSWGSHGVLCVTFIN